MLSKMAEIWDSLVKDREERLARQQPIKEIKEIKDLEIVELADDAAIGK
jgi:hypothetical protein